MTWKRINEWITLGAAIVAFLGAAYLLYRSFMADGFEGWAIRMACAYSMLAQAKKWIAKLDATTG